jgi:hypothetical protein
MYIAIGRRRAEPGKFRRIELRLPVGVERLECNGILQQTDDGAVPRRNVVHVICGRDAAGGRHVLRDNGGIAGNVLAEMLGESARVDIVAATHRCADDQLDIFALVEIGRLR